MTMLVVIISSQEMEANNRLIAMYKKRLREVPRTEELEEMKKAVCDLSASLKASQEREATQSKKLEFSRRHESRII